MMIKIEDERYVGGTPYASVLEVSGIMGALIKVWANRISFSPITVSPFSLI